jgi:hypothetical protein
METAQVRAAFRQAVDDAGAGNFLKVALKFADECRHEALDHAARLYLTEGASRTTHRPLVTHERFVELIGWSLDRPIQFPDRRSAAMALACSVIPRDELGTMTLEARYLTLHGTVQKSTEALNELAREFMPQARARKKGVFSFLRR